MLCILQISLPARRFPPPFPGFAAIVFALACLHVAAFAPIVDEPYLEVISSRMTCQDGGEGVGQWSVAPVHTSSNAVRPLYDPTGFLVIAEGTAWTVSLPERRNCTAPGMTSNNASLWQYPAQWTALTGLTASPTTDVVITDSAVPGSVVAVVQGGTAAGVVQFVTCSVSAAACKATSTVAAPFSFGVVHEAVVTIGGGAVTGVWVACDAGLAYLEGATLQFSLLLSASDVNVGGPITALAVSRTLPEVAAGNWMRLWIFDNADPTSQPWFEWATNIGQGWGGVLASNITALTYDDNTGALYVATTDVLNIRYANSTVERVDGFAGLPYTNLTSLAVQRSPVTGATVLHIGTQAGSIAADITPNPAETAGSAGGVNRFGYANEEEAAVGKGPGLQAAPLPVKQWLWSYRFLQRWLPGPSVIGITAHSDGDGSPFVLVATQGGPMPTPQPFVIKRSLGASGDGGRAFSGCGFALYEDQLWTLEAKAQRMAAIQERHSRYGMVADCALGSFGDTTVCTNGPTDNNGLWTSLVVAANALRYATTQDAEAAALAWHYYGGMKLLNVITGIRGLIGRSAISPNETHGPGGKWAPSTVPQYKGWTWKADASSDEVAGHLLAFTAMSTYMTNNSVIPGQGTPAEAAQFLLDLVTYITENGFQLIDFDGNPTTWGNWAPSRLNNDPSWSDERGLNSMQMLAMLASAMGAEGMLPPDANRSSILEKGWANLTASRYLRNIVNLKIEAPIDVNFSDDELTFLPYYTWLVAAQKSNSTTSAAGIPACLTSIQRTFRYVARGKSDLWHAIYAAAMAKWGYDDLVEPVTLQEMAWNLRTWPLDLVDWPTQNSHRVDFFYNPNINREYQYGTDATRVFPCNERDQGRWNSDPFQLDGGSGGSETDGGVWLLPYWLARANALLTAPAV